MFTLGALHPSNFVRQYLGTSFKEWTEAISGFIYDPGPADTSCARSQFSVSQKFFLIWSILIDRIIVENRLATVHLEFKPFLFRLSRSKGTSQEFRRPLPSHVRGRPPVQPLVQPLQGQPPDRERHGMKDVSLSSAAPAVAQSVKRPELRSLKEVQQN